MPKTLLAVDDSATMRKVLEITFSGDDFRVITADGSAAALGKLSEEPGVVIVDTALGPDDGYALCREIRRRDPSAAIVLLASRHNPYDVAQGREAGADDYMDKPFDTQQMLDKVRKAIQTREAAAVAAPPPAAASPAPSPASPAPLQRPGLAAPFAAPRLTVPSMASSDRARARTLMFGDRGQPVDATETDAPATSPKEPTAQPGSVASGSAGQTKPSAAIYPSRPQPVVSRKPEPASAPVQATAAAPIAHAPVSVAPAAHPVPVTQATPVAPAPEAAVSAALNGHLAGKLSELGLSPLQADAVMALSREVVEKVVWEVVPQLAEMLIKEEIARLTKEA